MDTKIVQFQLFTHQKMFYLNTTHKSTIKTLKVNLKLFRVYEVEVL